MTTEELYAQASEIEVNWRENYRAIGQALSEELRACECIYMNGGSDNESGDMESPVGHFYRVSRWIVQTDSQGFRIITSYETEDEASKAFGVLDDEYGEWGETDDE